MFGNLFLRLGFIAMLMAPLQTLCAQDQTSDPVAQAIGSAAKIHQHRLDFDGVVFSGPAWDRLLEEGTKAHFFLLGEEHGIAENPKLAAALFEALRSPGYNKLVIEISPTMADKLDKAILQDGMKGLRSLFAEPGGEPAFFGMQEEAEMLVAIRNSVADGKPVFWGVDYEVLSDRQLIHELEAMDKPSDAKVALANLAAASNISWSKHRETGDPGFIFSFNGDPDLVRAIRNAWPDREPRASQILDTLEETLQINALFLKGRNWASNARRAALIRKNFLRHWNDEAANGSVPKFMVKMGASHVVRGRSHTEAFDLGSLIPELAEMSGTRVFSVLVLPGRGAPTAVFDPVKLTFNAAEPKDGYADDLAPLTSAALSDAFTLIDLRPLREVRGLSRATINRNLLSTIMGFDMVLVMSGSSASMAMVPP